MPSPASAILAAAHFAADKHRDQRRKGPEKSPYINHPIEVAEVLAGVGGVTEVAVIQAALLHDTVEDTETTHEELLERFGGEVAGLVAEVTDDKSKEKSERKRLQVEHAGVLTPRAKMIKMADKICNVRDIGTAPPEGWSLDRRREYFDWAERVVSGCRDASPALARHFDETVAASRRALAENSTAESGNLPIG